MVGVCRPTLPDLVMLLNLKAAAVCSTSQTQMRPFYCYLGVFLSAKGSDPTNMKRTVASVVKCLTNAWKKLPMFMLMQINTSTSYLEYN